MTFLSVDGACIGGALLSSLTSLLFAGDSGSESVTDWWVLLGRVDRRWERTDAAERMERRVAVLTGIARASTHRRFDVAAGHEPDVMGVVVLRSGASAHHELSYAESALLRSNLTERSERCSLGSTDATPSPRLLLLVTHGAPEVGSTKFEFTLLQPLASSAEKGSAGQFAPVPVPLSIRNTVDTAQAFDAVVDLARQRSGASSPSVTADRQGKEYESVDHVTPHGGAVAGQTRIKNLSGLSAASQRIVAALSRAAELREEALRLEQVLVAD